MRYRLDIAYDGTFFYGFQRQKDKVSIQGTIEDALSQIFKEQIEIKGAGRTDSKVHAKYQVVHFDTQISIPLGSLKKVLNKKIAPHIYIKNIEIVDDTFHARLSAKKKEYRYFISLNEFDPFLANYEYFYPYKLNIDRMKEACKYFIGTNDFTSLSKTVEDNMIRTIETCELTYINNIITIRVVGDGFLHNMVRIIVALLLRVGNGRLEPIDIKTIIEAKSRHKAPYIAPSEGLYLWYIWY